MSCPKSVLGKHLWDEKGRRILCGATRGAEEAPAATFTLKYRVSDNGVELQEIEAEAGGSREKIQVAGQREDHVPFVLWKLRGTRGVSLVIDEQGRRRYLPTIIARAMELAGRKIKEVAWAPTFEELKRKGF